jgi:signal transduction histidine kinase
VYPFKGKNYVVTAAAKDDFGLSKLRHLRYNLVIGFAAAILLTLLAGILFSRKALAPVSKMVEKVGEISANRLDLRIDTGTSRDEISELARTFNQMLARLESSFEAQRQFVSNISHELRTPLAAIIAELEISALKGRTVDEYRETIRLILQDAHRLSRLSNDLLDLAKASYDQSGIHFRPVRLDEVLLDARQSILRANGGYRVDIRYEKEPEEGDGVVIRGNEYLLKVAFINLIENACKFSDDHRCVVTISFGAGKTVLRFADDGIGIPEADVEYVFTPFYRGQNKKHAPGNGIGLSLTQKIVALHHGTIAVESRVGEGTTFTVELRQS